MNWCFLVIIIWWRRERGLQISENTFNSLADDELWFCTTNWRFRGDKKHKTSIFIFTTKNTFVLCCLLRLRASLHLTGGNACCCCCCSCMQPTCTDAHACTDTRELCSQNILWSFTKCPFAVLTAHTNCIEGWRGAGGCVSTVFIHCISIFTVAVQCAVSPNSSTQPWLANCCVIVCMKQCAKRLLWFFGLFFLCCCYCSVKFNSRLLLQTLRPFLYISVASRCRPSPLPFTLHFL